MPDRISWTVAEPGALAREQYAVSEVAPDLDWWENDGACGWSGQAPVWPLERNQPLGLGRYLGGRRLTIDVVYSAAHPMAPPKIWPVDPEPEFLARTQHRWHVNGDGSLCLLQAADDWDGQGTAADLVVKAAGWFLEYLLLSDGVIDAMTESGIVSDASLDRHFT